jgi:PAS domain-containing protein
VFANRYAETITERVFGRRANLDVKAVTGQAFHPDGTPFERDDWPLMRATRGEKVADEELVYRLPDGTALRLLLSAAPVYDGEGHVVAAVVVGRDITQQDPGDSASLKRGL